MSATKERTSRKSYWERLIRQADGWKCVGQAGGLRWTGKRRPKVDLYPAQMKLRFEIGEDNETDSV